MALSTLPLLALLACGDDTTSGTTDSATATTDSGTVTDSADTGTPDSGTDTDTDTDCPAVTQLTVAGGERQLLALDLGVETDLETGVWAVCTADDDPDEQHLAESGTAATAHSLGIQGLAPETAYTCEARTTCGAATPASVSHTTPALPPDVSGFQVTLGDHPSWGEYTLTAEIEPCEDYDTTNLHGLVLDSQGVPRWFYDVPDAIVSSDVEIRYLGDGLIHIAGGWGQFDTRAPHQGMFRTLDLSNQVIHHRDAPDLGLGFNHHSIRLETGEYVTHTYALHGGFNVGMTVEVWDPETEAITWSWDSEQTWLDGEGIQGSGAEIWASNSLTWIDDALGPALYVNVVTTDSIWRVDRDTGRVTHILGVGQGWSLFDADGDALDADEDWFYFQHDPEITADGRVLMHDNGQGRPGRNKYSRVVEYQIDWERQVLTETWVWGEPDWYNPYLGDADRLPNDNVLVATGHIWCASGYDDASSVFEIEPSSGELAWRMDWDNPDFATYRAERLGGCDIFANAATCPAVAERIAALGDGTATPGR